METNAKRLKIAVVGGGIAGIAAAWLLSRAHEVTLLEQADRLGGHTNTRTVHENHRCVPVDTGFIVCNPVNYPNFYRLLDAWGVQRRDSDMSFGFSCEASGFGWVGPSLSQFARMPENFMRPACWRMLFNWRRFNRLARTALASGSLSDQTLGSFLERNGLSTAFIDTCLIPLAASVWSSPDGAMLQFPAASFIQFFENHGLLQLARFPRWQTIVGGSNTYINAFEGLFPGHIKLKSRILEISRISGSPRIKFQDRSEEQFDQVVLATHADTSLRLLADPSPEEQTNLSCFRYHESSVVLHYDTNVMPTDRRNWASWNYRRPRGSTSDDPVPITYHMNRLQGLESERDYFVTLNSRHAIDRSRILYETTYTHPAYTPEAVTAQDRIHAMNGSRQTHFCGSYMGHGFHEDAAASACAVAARFGIQP